MQHEHSPAKPDYSASTPNAATARNGDAEHGDDFVVPEPDGVQSGVPFEPADDPTARRPANSSPRAGGSLEPGAGLQQGLAAHRGMSLKLKLLGSLGLLTLVILVLGLVSVLTLERLSVLGVTALRAQAELAHRTETLVTAIHHMYENEQDMLAGEAGARERLQRRFDAVQAYLDDVEVQAARIPGLERDLTGSYAGLSDLLADYAVQIDAYATATADTEERLAAERAAEAELAEALAVRLTPALEAMAELVGLHWQRRGTADAADAVDFGLGLGALERGLWAVGADVQRFHQTNTPALAEAARAVLTGMLARLDVARDAAPGRAVRDGLAQVR